MAAFCALPVEPDFYFITELHIGSLCFLAAEFRNSLVCFNFRFSMFSHYCECTSNSAMKGIFA